MNYHSKYHLKSHFKVQRRDVITSEVQCQMSRIWLLAGIFDHISQPITSKHQIEECSYTPPKVRNVGRRVWLYSPGEVCDISTQALTSHFIPGDRFKINFSNENMNKFITQIWILTYAKLQHKFPLDIGSCLNSSRLCSQFTADR